MNQSKMLTKASDSRPQDRAFAGMTGLVIDSNSTTRSILVNQLKDLGVASVAQASRTIDARKQLELRSYDIVLCEQQTGRSAMTGQQLLDDLRRNNLLPASTIFLMVTAESSYTKVSEAAESALDGYLLKPHTAAGLTDRLYAALARKKSLAQIISAIEANEFDTAVELCRQRFEAKGPYWLYASRMAAELLLRLAKNQEAKQFFEDICASQELSWARLGVARAQLQASEVRPAIETLATIIREDPRYTEAYEVLAAAQMEAGNLAQALEAYKTAAEQSQNSISRTQAYGMMLFYTGERERAAVLLSHAVRLGVNSKLFDPQGLVLLAFCKQGEGDRKAAKQCRDELTALMGHRPDLLRLTRLRDTVDAILATFDDDKQVLVRFVEEAAQQAQSSKFDVESASNFLSLLAVAQAKGVRFSFDAHGVVDRLGLRFCTKKVTVDLLAGACHPSAEYAKSIHECFGKVLKIGELAMKASLNGSPGDAVKQLITEGEATMNAKLLDMAHLVLQRYGAEIELAKELGAEVDLLRKTFGSLQIPSEVSEALRAPGGISLRYLPKKSPSAVPGQAIGGDLPDAPLMLAAAQA